MLTVILPRYSLFVILRVIVIIATSNAVIGFIVIINGSNINGIIIMKYVYSLVMCDDLT